MKKKTALIIISLIILLIEIPLFFYAMYREETKEVNQGIYGSVVMFTGNCMPGSDSTCGAFHFPTIIYVREPVYEEQMNDEGIYLKEKTKLVKKIVSDFYGDYKVELPVGTYSVFAGDLFGEYCNVGSMDSGIVCEVIVTEDSLTGFEIRIDHAVW